MLVIRLAQLEDFNQIIELQTRSLKILCSQDYSWEQLESLANDQKHWVGYDETIFIAEYDGRLVGFSSLLNSSPEISGLYVTPELARKGVGTQLLAVVEKAAIKRRERFLKVVSSLTAVPFYEAKGYRLLVPSSLWTSTGVWIPCMKLEKNL
jgi:putative acetyltransferase